jgi:hypothetical protein
MFAESMLIFRQDVICLEMTDDVTVQYMFHDLTTYRGQGYRASIKQGKIPNQWKEVLITPLFKKGDRGKASNYRPVSLTSICCKIMEHILHSNIISHLQANN